MYYNNRIPEYFQLANYIEISLRDIRKMWLL
jgi:hypothetical protein